jgi:sec-independent protein translocase protein TatB
MFDFSWSELLLIGAVALIFIGPKELPGVLRTLGQWMSKIRRMAGDFQNQFHDAMREAELADLKKEVDDMAAHAAQYSNFDPLADVRKGMESAQQEVEKAVADSPMAGSPAAGEPASHAQTPAAEPSAPSDTSPPVAKAGEGAKEPAQEPAKHNAAGSEPA